MSDEQLAREIANELFTNGIGEIADRIEPLIEDAEKWQSRPDSVHERTCHACGNKAIHADNITPYVTCRECGPNDTRRKRDTP